MAAAAPGRIRPMRMAARMLQAARANPGALLAASTLVLLPFGRVVEGPVLLMAALGLWALLRRPRETLAGDGARALTALFACAWLPMLVSLPDAVSVERTATVVANHLRFWLSGLFLISALASPQARRVFLRVTAAVVAFWVLDALLQYFTGRNLLGYEAWPNRLGSVFGPDNSKFGLTLAVFAPLLWHEARHGLGRTGAAVFLVLSLVVVVLAYSRAGWIAGIAAASAWVLLRTVSSRRGAIALTGAIVLVIGVVGAGAYASSDLVRGRVDDALVVFDDDADHRNSIVHRIWIWGAGLRMFQAHPVNGIGARGFREAFDDFARPDDPYLRMDPPQRPTHSHQLLIEIATETGVIGLAGLVLMWVLLVRTFLRTQHTARPAVAALAACLVGAYFPLNTHLAIYSAYWSQIVWLLLGLYCAFAARAGRSSDASSEASALRTRAAENHSS